MSTQGSWVKQSDLPKRLILDSSTTDDLGHVDQLWLDPQAHTVLGLTSISGFWKRKKHAFPWNCIQAIGADSILINRQGMDIEPQKPEQVAPIINHELWTDSGNKAGHIVDYLIDPDTGSVVGYLFRSNGWSGLMEGTYMLPPSAIVSVGHQRVIAQDAAIRNSEQYEKGLDEKIGAMQDFIKEDLQKTKQDWDAVRQSSQEIAAHTRETAQTVTKQMKERFAEGEHPDSETKTAKSEENQ
jgi:uncharacterized protein YrrD